MNPRCLLPLLVCAIPLAHGQIVYEAFLDGPSESPPNASPGSGIAKVAYDSAAHTLTLDVSFAGLLGTTTASHIHAPTATPFDGIAGAVIVPPTLPLFPLGVTSGTYSHVFDLLDTTTYSAAFVTASGGTAAGAEAAMATYLADGKAYLNIHSAAFGGGEIRGFFVPVPEPAGTTLVVAGLLGAFGLYRRHSRRGEDSTSSAA
ncbi:MAG: CHRD domain-containing protein [Verrucomicrobiales bacterium]|nr:CHRD domain-containing protein [Verrucomicrobiales bacterium]